MERSGGNGSASPSIPRHIPVTRTAGRTYPNVSRAMCTGLPESTPAVPTRSLFGAPAMTKRLRNQKSTAKPRSDRNTNNLPDQRSGAEMDVAQNLHHTNISGAFQLGPVRNPNTRGVKGVPGGAIKVQVGASGCTHSSEFSGGSGDCLHCLSQATAEKYFRCTDESDEPNQPQNHFCCRAHTTTANLPIQTAQQM